MKITLDFSTCTEESLIALAKGCKDRDVLHKLFNVRNIEVKRAVIENEALTAEDRGQLYSKEYRYRLVSAFISHELTTETIHKIALDCGEQITNYYELLYRDNMSIETLNMIYDSLMRIKQKEGKFYIEKTLKLVAEHKSADENLLNKILRDDYKLVEVVARRKDYRLEVVSNDEVEE